eukprot:g23356.t1
MMQSQMQAAKGEGISQRAMAKLPGTINNLWDKTQDDRLHEAVLTHGENWKKIAKLFPGKSSLQCANRYLSVLQPGLVKGPWTKQEDENLIEFVQKYGSKWTLVSKCIPGRIGKQCRERWFNYLRPGILKTPWTVEEDNLIIHYQRVLGNKWSEIAKRLKGRSANSIKNRWNGTLTRVLLQRSQNSSVGNRSQRINMFKH